MAPPIERRSILRRLLGDATHRGLALFATVLLLSEPMAKDVRVLEPGKPVERELAGGEAHSYRLTLTAGQYLHVLVEQRGINVVVALRGPDGAQLMEMDGLSGMLGAEELVWEAADSGVYVLEVRARARQANKGRYEVKLQTAAGTSGRERARIAAQQLFMEGKRAQEEGSGAGLERAIKKYEEAEAKWREAGERKWEGETLNNLGHVYWKLSRFEKAREYFEPALVIMREIEDRRVEGSRLNNLGHVYYNLSQYEKAREYFEPALVIMREIKDRSGEGETLNNLGHLYWGLNQYERARDYFEQALVISREIKDRRVEGWTLNDLGVVYRNLSQHEKAQECFEQALAIKREIKDRSGEGWTLNKLGAVYLGLSQYERAQECFEQALAIRREIKDRSGEGWTLNYLGIVYRRLSQHEKARDHFEQALVISQEIKDRSGEGWTLYGMARFERDRGNLSEARARIEAALPLIESIRTDVAGTDVAGQELRSSYFASVQDYYELYIDLLMRLHKQRPAEGLDAVALQASERARARSLLELLTEARADIRQGVDPKLLEQERSLQQQLNAKAERLTRLLGRKPSREQAAKANKEVEQVRTELHQVQAQIRKTSPRYAALTQPQPLSLREIQQQVLDPNTILLEYSLGEKHSYLWAVTHSSISSYQLPNRKQIETAARQGYELLTSAQPAQGQTAKQSEARYWQQAATLSQMLLGPVAPQLGKKRLLIVADGALQFLSFAALPRPSAQGSGVRGQGSGKNKEALPRPLASGPRPLIVDHEIVSLPSASSLAVLRREVATRKPATKLVAVLADPVFEKDDPRIKSNGKDKPSSATDRSSDHLKRALRDFAPADGELDLPRLLGSQQEAEAIRALAPTGQAMAALGFEANRATATDPQMSQYRIVHLATHGLLNSQHPELSGIVLSLFDEQGQQQDGFLRLHEIYNLNLPAELVVLSACNTALGKQIKGEGIVGLTRGFMYAGAARVMASLWKVDDEATAELMKRFYEKMMGGGVSASAALRGAQIEMSRQRQWGAPYHWAGFVLQGEWK